MAERTLILCCDAEELNQKAAEQFIAAADRALKSTGRFTVALSGGSTPKGLYALLASAPYSPRVSWNQVHLFWGDERCVAPDHPESNYRMARESLISRVPIPAANVHRMRGELEPEAAAAQYERTLRDFFSLSEGALPRFDLIFLGLGEDGHTASLFPASAALEERRRWVAAVHVEKFKAHRLTLTLPVLNRAANVLFLVAGASKAAIVKALFETASGGAEFPAARVQPVDGALAWYMTQDAAVGLPHP